MTVSRRLDASRLEAAERGASVERDPEVQSIAADAVGLGQSRRIEGTEGGQVPGFPERETIADVVGDQDSLPIERDAGGPVEPVAAEGRQDRAGRSSHDRDRAVRVVRNPDVGAVENRVSRLRADRDAL